MILIKPGKIQQKNWNFSFFRASWRFFGFGCTNRGGRKRLAGKSETLAELPSHWSGT
jgi:hypothetical protein